MTTKRIIMWSATGALVAASAVALNAMAQVGANAGPAASEIRLHLGTDSQKVSYGTTVQNLTVKKCVVDPAGGQVINLTSGPSGSPPGLVDSGLGVKNGANGATGTPCGQIEAPNEVLTVGLGTATNGRTFNRLHLDLEVTKNALVQVTLLGGGQPNLYTLQTGTNIANGERGELDTVIPYVVDSSANDTTDGCSAANSSGPNSGPSDNCEWNIDPGFNFTSFSIKATIGTVALEGGNDFGPGTAMDSVFYLSNGAPTANNDTANVDQNRSDFATNNSVLIPVLANDTDPENDTLSVLAGSVSDPPHGTAVIEGSSIRYTPDADDYSGPDSFTYQATDGTTTSSAATVSVDVVQVMCSTETVSTPPVPSGVSGSFTRMTDTVQCKRYTLQINATDSGPAVQFAPQGGTDVDYRGSITFGPKPEPTGTLNLLLQYDPELDNTYKNVPWCDAPMTFDANGVVTEAHVPAGDSWCIASETTVGQGTGTITTTWQVWGHDDPQFR